MTTTTTEKNVDLYPSRTGSEPTLIDRQDPALWGGPDDGPLARDELARYEKNGFLIYPGLFSDDDLRRYVRQLARLCAGEQIEDRDEVITEPESREVRSIFAIHESDEILSRLCRHPRLVAIARQLLGSDVYIHQSRVDHKAGFTGRELHWHSDFETWHVEDGMPRMRAVSCSVSLTANTPHNAPPLLIPGSHEKFLSRGGEPPEDPYRESLERQDHGVPHHASLARMVEEGGIEAAVGPAGTVVFFECNMMRGSSSNITPLPWSHCLTVYNSVENTLVEPFCGLAPRPRFIGNRDDFSPVETA